VRVVIAEDLFLLRDGLVRLPPSFTDEGLRTALEARRHGGSGGTAPLGGGK
jgi:hypothetical protein